MISHFVRSAVVARLTSSPLSFLLEHGPMKPRTARRGCASLRSTRGYRRRNSELAYAGDSPGPFELGMWEPSALVRGWDTLRSIDAVDSAGAPSGDMGDSKACAPACVQRRSAASSALGAVRRDQGTRCAELRSSAGATEKRTPVKWDW